jgi:hypothetical protein
MSMKTILPPQQFIEKVRRSFLIDDDVPEHLREGAKNLQTQLNNALRLLSEDLYSKKSHFVLELVQNADDNTYRPDSTPELTFQIEPNRLVLSNNEIGFSEENISAICKVGASSKAQNKQNHIGEKGIGFKSVFSVSNAPEIHSNGFHFRFDRSDPTNLLGYVVPSWCEPPEVGRLGYTTIILPAAPGYVFNDSTISDLDSRVLLFLNKLRQLTLVQGDIQRTYRRIDHNGLSQLKTSEVATDGTSSETSLRYVRVTKTFPMVDACADVKRPGVSQSTIVLAFPVDEGGAAMLEPASYVFAYLPIHQVGFKFPLHADFILNSGREGVLNDRPWNQRLRDGVAETFASALGEFKKSSELALTYLRYVPEETDIADDFFGKLRPEIVNRLAEEESLLSSSGTWHRPNALRLADKEFRALFPSAQALSLFGFDYIDSRVQGGTALLKELGVCGAGCLEILEIFTSHQAWLAVQPLEWRAMLYAFIADDLTTFIKAGLLKIPCLPTSTGTCVIPAQANVFFPLGRGKKYGFEHELVIVDSELYDAAVERSAEAVSLFEAMEVHTDDPYELVVAHILPRHAAEDWKKSKFQALVGHMRYIKDKLNLFLEQAGNRGKTHSQAYQMLRDGMWIGTKLVSESGAWTFNHAGNLYLGKEYRPAFCIETLTSGEPGAASYVSASYLAEKPKDADAEATSWREFFAALGVRTCPAVEASGTDWRSSKELSVLLDASSPTTRKETLECLSQHWHSYSGKLTQHVSTGRYRAISTETAFSRQIREMVAPLHGKRMVVPLSESYYKTEELHSILGDGLPYIDAFMNSQMLDDCGVTHRLNAESLVKRLNQLKQNDAGTTKQVQAIYRVLEGRLWDTDSSFIRQSFEDDGLIQLKGNHRGWFSPSEVAWQTNGQFLDSLYPPVQSLYRDFQGFFIEKLRIPRLLPISTRVEALKRLDEIADRDTRETEALAIYKRAEQALKPQFGREIDVPDWIETFSDEAVFVDHRGDVVGNGPNLFANDSASLAELFADEEDLSFLAIPSVEVPRLSRLLKAAAIARLSEAIFLEVERTNAGRVDTDLTSRVQRAIPYLARVLYSRQPEAFESALEDGRFNALWSLAVVEVEAVNLRVNLGQFSRRTTTDAAMADGQILYRMNAKSLKDRVAAELSKYLVGTVEFADTFARILLENNSESIEEFLGVATIGHLPSDLERTVRQRELLVDPEIEGAVEEITSDDGSFSDESEEALASKGEEAVYDASLAQPTNGELTNVASSPGLGAKENLISPVGADPVPLPLPLPELPNLASPSGSGGEFRFHPPQPSPKKTDGENPRLLAPAFDKLPRDRSFDNPFQRVAAPSRRTAQQSPHRNKSGRLLSYVEGPTDPDKPRSEEGPAKAAARDATSRAAVAYFLKTQATRWASLTEMPHNNPGFDVLAQNASGEEEYIEVKGQSGAWTKEGVALTPTELLTAQKMKDRYWLCVVEFAQDDKQRQLHLLRDPFGLIDQFRFDVGWKAAAENVVLAPTIPEKGLYVDITGEGVGRILSVRGKGRFFHLHVILKGGKQINSLFHPVKMSLSKEPLWQE